MPRRLNLNLSNMAKEETIIIDAGKRSFGRVASEIAHHLRGKHRAGFTPHENPNVRVEVTNLAAVRFTGKKYTQKMIKHYTGYPSGLRSARLRDRWEKNPEQVLRNAVRRMLPANRLRSKILKNLIVKK